MCIAQQLGCCSQYQGKTSKIVIWPLQCLCDLKPNNHWKEKNFRLDDNSLTVPRKSSESLKIPFKQITPCTCIISFSNINLKYRSKCSRCLMHVHKLQKKCKFIVIFYSLKCKIYSLKCKIYRKNVKITD